MSHLAYVPVSWHRVPVVIRDDRGRLRATGELTDRWRAHPVGWIDDDRDGLVWVLGDEPAAPRPDVPVDHRPVGRPHAPDVKT